MDYTSLGPGPPVKTSYTQSKTGKDQVGKGGFKPLICAGLIQSSPWSAVTYAACLGFPRDLSGS